jgi:hypothetical protein
LEDVVDFPATLVKGHLARGDILSGNAQISLDEGSLELLVEADPEATVLERIVLRLDENEAEMVAVYLDEGRDETIKRDGCPSPMCSPGCCCYQVCVACCEAGEHPWCDCPSERCYCKGSTE